MRRGPIEKGGILEMAQANRCGGVAHAAPPSRGSLLVGRVLVVDVTQRFELERAVLHVEVVGEAVSQRV